MSIDSVAGGANAAEASVGAVISAPDPKPAKVETEPIEKPADKPADAEQAKPPVPVAFDEGAARKIAAEFEQSLNRSDQTVIRFNVSLVNGEDSNTFKFQVVDSTTGKVIRQFPPEDILNVKGRLEATPPSSGVLVDHIA